MTPFVLLALKCLKIWIGAGAIGYSLAYVLHWFGLDGTA